jgi:proteic killer suppression protein
VDVEFADDDLDKLETDFSFHKGLQPPVVRQYRKLLQFIRASADERDFYAWKGLHYKKMEGKRQHQHSMRLNDQYRLVLEIKVIGPKKTVLICEVDDTH